MSEALGPVFNRVHRVYARAYELLSETVSAAYEEGSQKPAEVSNLRETTAYRHARTIYQLADDTDLLILESRFHSVPLVLRAILESLFILGAIARSVEFAPQKIVAELDAFIDYARTHLEAGMLQELEEFRGKIKTEFNLTRSRKFTTRDVAKIADLDGFYVEYKQYCAPVHASLNGLISGEHLGAVGRELAALGFYTASAAAFLAMIVESEQSQFRIDEATSIMNRILLFRQSGVVSTLDGLQENFKRELNELNRDEISEEEID